MMDIKFAVLTTEGSPAAFRVLAQLKSDGFTPDTICILKPNAKKNIRRVVRKLYSAGPTATLKRILQVLRNRKQTQDAAPSQTYQSYAAKVVYTQSFIAPDLLARLKAENFDVFVAITDEILPRKIFSIPRFGTLNAHPGENPRYRGLSATIRMIRDGLQPVISIHLIDEGVDTGPLIARLPVTDQVVKNGEIDDAVMSKNQGMAFTHALRMLQAQGHFTFIDTFLEESNMARALKATDQKKILAKLG